MDRSSYWDAPVNGSAPTIRARLLDRVGDNPLHTGNLLSQMEQGKLQGIAKPGHDNLQKRKRGRVRLRCR
jgi:hypothetical protein